MGYITTPTVQGMKDGSVASIILFGFVFGIILTLTLYAGYIYMTEPTLLSGDKDTWLKAIIVILSCCFLYFITVIGGLLEMHCDVDENLKPKK